MAPRSKISTLPKAVQDWLNKTLLDANFSGYELLEAQINHKLEEMGASYRISKTAIHRHGQALERRLAAVRASTEAARELAEAAPDQADQRSQAVISMVQSDIFNTLLLMQEADGESGEDRLKIMSQAARAIADLTRASVNNKEWQQKFEEKARAEARAQAAETAAQVAKEAGVSDETIQTIRRALGMNV